MVFVGVLSLMLWGGSAFADKRVALVIGNSSYVHTAKLPNPENDAHDLADTLRSLKFDTILKINLTWRELDGALEEFERKAQGADVALFFFAGHGLQYHGKNYLLPVDADLEDEVSLRYNTLAIDKVRDAFVGTNGVKILVLDACRNNPLSEKLNAHTSGVARSVGMTRGLARIDRADGTVVAYATQADQVAQDGSGRNSPFSAALIRRLREPNLEIGTLFRRVAQDVYEQTDGRQRPELSISLLQDFYLNRRDEDERAWSRLGAAATESDLKAFIAKFPDSPYAREAENRMAIFENVKKEYARLEVEQLAAQREAERKEACAREAARIDQLAASKQKDALARLKPQLVCSELAASVDRALAKVAAAEEQICHNESADLRKLGPKDLDGLIKFAEAAQCETARKEAAANIAALEAAAAQAARRQAEADAEQRKHAQLCADQSAEIGRMAAAKQRDGLAQMSARLACPELGGAIVEALAKLDAQEAQAKALQLVRQRLEAKRAAENGAAIADDDLCGKERQAFQDASKEGLAALKKFVGGAKCDTVRKVANNIVARLQAVACRDESDRLAALKAQRGIAPDILAKLNAFQTNMSCDTLRDDVAATIASVQGEEDRAAIARRKIEFKLKALGEEGATRKAASP
jgi:hypothetical protein